MTRPPEFRVVTERTGAIVSIRVFGELDLATAPTLDAEIAAVRAAGTVQRLIVDLRDLAFLDSTGLEVILRLDATGRDEGFEVAVVRGPRAVDRLFAVMQLDRRLRVVDDPAELASAGDG
jgi:anti-sigma B factor antagonist